MDLPSDIVPDGKHVSMKTRHEIFYKDARNMRVIPSGRVDLVVTSPPYPMIAMWDDLFVTADPAIGGRLRRGDGPTAFELMHQILDPVWDEIYRVLKPGAIACVNIGDATRTIHDNFALYPNHARILTYLQKIGFQVLPTILWRKQTNAPNKFMGSGMMPPGAYVTLEHEYVLIFRKGARREFKTPGEKERRRMSAMFWEERNRWFSDIWLDLKGVRQAVAGGRDVRKRSAAFPFALAYRLINMYSVRGDTVLDPFLGTGTTTAAAVAAGRNSIGYEIDVTMASIIDEAAGRGVSLGRAVNRERLGRHLDFVAERMKNGGGLKHQNRFYGFPVMTGQETALLFNDPVRAEKTGRLPDEWTVAYDDAPQADFVCFNP